MNPEPKPEEEQRPEPVDEPKPAPSPDEEKPKPVESEAPKPVESEAPKPIVTEAPKPVESEAPKPVVSEAPKPVVSEAPAPKPSPVIPKPDYTLAPLPAAVTPTANQDILSCSSANQQLMDDVATCSEPLKKASAANVKEADEMAKGAVKCICTSRWEAGNTVAKYAVQSICPAPANMTKSDQYRVYISCNTQPYKETEIIDGLGLYVRLSNGDLYEPLSKKTSPSNRAQIGGLIPLLVVLGWAFAWIL